MQTKRRYTLTIAQFANARSSICAVATSESMLRFSRKVARIVEYGVLGAIMAAAITSALTLVKTSLGGPFSALAFTFEQPGQVLRVAPASSPAVAGRVRFPGNVYSILP